MTWQIIMWIWSGMILGAIAGASVVYLVYRNKLKHMPSKPTNHLDKTIASAAELLLEPNALRIIFKLFVTND